MFIKKTPAVAASTSIVPAAPTVPAVPTSQGMVVVGEPPTEGGGGAAGRGAQAFGQIVSGAGVGAAAAAGGDLVLGVIGVASLGGQVLAIAADEPRSLVGGFLMGMARQLLPSLATVATYKAVDRAIGKVGEAAG
jgi:hypothetical protein